MKQTTLLLLALCLSITLLARTGAALFGWTSTEHNFGKIAQGKPVTAEFKFTNKGEVPLLITHAYGSCGCTGVAYPKAPVLPGATATLRATFNAVAAGPFNKTVTVESNAEGGIATLRLTGEVVF